jgi:hypothetical protein
MEKETKITIKVSWDTECGIPEDVEKALQQIWTDVDTNTNRGDGYYLAWEDWEHYDEEY